MTDIKQRWNRATGNFSNNRYVSGTRDFLASNTLAAKFVFLILVIIGFIIILRLGVSFLAWIFAPPRNPKLVNCIKDAKKFLLVSQNPNMRGSKPIVRSVNQRGGLEFTWTVWLYIDDLEYKSGQRKHIFHKGNDKFNSDKTAYPNNAPGMYLHPTRNAIIIVMNTFDKILEEVEVNDIPLHKWICVAVRLRGKVMDVYVNGDIVLRHVFTAIPRQNYGDVYVNMNGGYSGHLSDLWYHDYSLSGVEIQQIVSAGPCLRLPNQRGPALPPYFALAWYFQNDQAPSAPAGPHWPTLSP